jgi:hypothetical protein
VLQAQHVQVGESAGAGERAGGGVK